LQSVAGSHLKERGKEAEVAEAMILAEVTSYQRRLHALNVAPQIVQLQQSAEQIRQAELRRVASRLQSLSPEQQAAVEALTRGLINKFLHQPVQAIKAAATEGNMVAVDAIREAFGVSGAGHRSAEEDVFEDLPELEDQEPKS
jgi:glutamyl-tRNA reductase